MDFWTDIAFAVLFRILKDRRARENYRPVFLKLHFLIGEWLKAEEIESASRVV